MAVSDHIDAITRRCIAQLSAIEAHVRAASESPMPEPVVDDDAPRGLLSAAGAD